MLEDVDKQTFVIPRSVECAETPAAKKEKASKMTLYV